MAERRFKFPNMSTYVRNVVEPLFAALRNIHRADVDAINAKHNADMESLTRYTDTTAQQLRDEMAALRSSLVSQVNTVVDDVATRASAVGDFVASYLPSKPGYLICNGAAVSRTTYSNLFAVLGTQYGEGDGSTTFNIPDMRNRVIWGAAGNRGTMIAAGLPHLKGISDIRGYSGYDSPASGVFYDIGTGTSYTVHGGNGGKKNGFDASRYDTIYGNSTTVQPPAAALNIFIKY